ncbi:hypothetical protein Pmani_000385 [Petrolisthes manimaculis]|uniref:Uncharacterized protein n=1 Tax=Petrolisthes manimaculis TaxID=1843537 RepID=A0AAE1QMR0_9EUCA|nr:hypothetical protein Pmani_000385 [Petrolisthes manimaculis]
MNICKFKASKTTTSECSNCTGPIHSWNHLGPMRLNKFKQKTANKTINRNQLSDSPHLPEPMVYLPGPGLPMTPPSYSTEEEKSMTSRYKCSSSVKGLVASLFSLFLRAEGECSTAS